MGKGYISTLLRFPLVLAFLTAAVIINMISIHTGNEPYSRLLISLFLGTGLSLVFQMIYERLNSQQFLRYLYMGITIMLSLLYYLIIRYASWNEEIIIKTMVILFILLIAFLWVPVIRSPYHFNQSFLAAFKAFFMALFFHGVLFLGIILLFGVTELLIFNVSEKAYFDAANIIFILMAPVYFLSLIPYYPGKDSLKNITSADSNPKTSQNRNVSDASEEKNTLFQETELTTADEQRKREEALVRLTSPVRFLEALVSYVVIPITAVFTIILLLYILMNIKGEFWSDNLMEPLLVSYSIVVIIVYLLASTMNNALTKYFCLIFPKVLVLVVLFQTLSSILKIGDAGLTYGRYYVIMFGLFATAAGVIFSALPVRRNGLIAPILIALSVISILPCMDAFTLSRISQTNRLVHVLEKNGMFDKEKIIPNADITDKDKETIISSVQYLNRMGYTRNIAWLKNINDNYYTDFKPTFGFDMYEQAKNISKNVSVMRDQSTPIPITGYDFILHGSVSNNGGSFNKVSFQKDGVNYSLRFDSTPNQVLILEKEEKELLQLDVMDIYNKYSNENGQISASTKDVTFTEENTAAILTVVADDININEWDTGKGLQADIYVLVKLK